MSAQAKPGCYSSPLCFDATTPPCSACNWRSSCGPSSMKVAIDLRQRFGIDRIHTKRGPGARRAVTTKAIMAEPATVTVKIEGDPSLPKKALELIASLNKQGINLKEAMEHGKNPFLTRPPAFMRTLVQRLLDAGGFTREEAKEFLVKLHGWSDQTASSHLSFAIPALVTLGVAEESDAVVTRKVIA